MTIYLLPAMAILLATVSFVKQSIHWSKVKKSFCDRQRLREANWRAGDRRR
jgi:hypothetical protein